MLKTRLLLILNFSAIVAGAFGCRGAQLGGGCHQQQVHRNDTVTVKVEGDVATPKTITLPVARAKLVDALRAVGGADEFKTIFDKPILTFAKFTRKGEDYYIATPLIEDTVLGNLPLQNGDIVTVLPWTQTDLARTMLLLTRKEQAPIDGSEREIIRQDGFDYDDKSLLAAYNVDPKTARDRPIAVEYNYSDGYTPPQGLSKVNLILNDGAIELPPVLSTLSQNDPAVFFLTERIVDGVPSHFYTTRMGAVDKLILNAVDSKATDLVLKYAPVFDGDVFSALDENQLSIPGPKRTASPRVQEQRRLLNFKPREK